MRARDGSTPEATLSRTIVTKVMRERVAMLADDARYDSRLDGAGSIQAMVNIRSFMCAPLWNRNEVIGVLYADNPKQKRFTAEDLDVLPRSPTMRQSRSSRRASASSSRGNAEARTSAAVPLAGGRQPDHRRRRRRIDAAFEAQERDVTVMFVDLVGFTTPDRAR